jgi:hypothetical protein
MTSVVRHIHLHIAIDEPTWPQGQEDPKWLMGPGCIAVIRLLAPAQQVVSNMYTDRCVAAATSKSHGLCSNDVVTPCQSYHVGTNSCGLNITTSHHMLHTNWRSFCKSAQVPTCWWPRLQTVGTLCCCVIVLLLFPQHASNREGWRGKCSVATGRACMKAQLSRIVHG